MTKTLLAASALVLMFGSASIASVPKSDTVLTQGKSDSTIIMEARRKARVPGGSGCDSAHDRAEHPECNG